MHGHSPSGGSGRCQTPDPSLCSATSCLRPKGLSWRNSHIWQWPCHQVLQQLQQSVPDPSGKGAGCAQGSPYSKAIPLSFTLSFDNDPLMERIKVGSPCLAAVLHSLQMKTGFGSQSAIRRCSFPEALPAAHTAASQPRGCLQGWGTQTAFIHLCVVRRQAG